VFIQLTDEGNAFTRDLIKKIDDLMIHIKERTIHAVEEAKIPDEITFRLLASIHVKQIDYT
jgi:hypothetical protein